jgi:hypothetical protein
MGGKSNNSPAPGLIPLRSIAPLPLCCVRFAAFTLRICHCRGAMERSGISPCCRASGIGHHVPCAGCRVAGHRAPCAVLPGIGHHVPCAGCRVADHVPCAGCCAIIALPPFCAMSGTESHREWIPGLPSASPTDRCQSQRR